MEIGADTAVCGSAHCAEMNSNRGGDFVSVSSNLAQICGRDSETRREHTQRHKREGSAPTAHTTVLPAHKKTEIWAVGTVC